MSLFWCLALVNYHIFYVISSEPASMKPCISANAIPTYINPCVANLSILTRPKLSMMQIIQFSYLLDYPPCLLLPQSKYTDRRSYISNLHHFHPPGAQFRYVANKLNDTFALMLRGWISRLIIKIPQPSNLHTTYLFRDSMRWYAQKNIFKPEVSKNSVAMATYLN